MCSPVMIFCEVVCNGRARATTHLYLFENATQSVQVMVCTWHYNNTLRTRGEEDDLYQGGILMFIYTMANKMCALQCVRQNDGG